MPDIITSGDYGSIRTALGIGSADTTTLADAIITDRLYLTWVERKVKALIPTWATILTGNDDREETLKDAVVQWTASRLAALWFARRQAEEVQSEKVDSLAVSWREGYDWQKLAADLADEAARSLAEVENWGADMPAISMFSRSGPTRAGRLAETGRDLTWWRDQLKPPIVRGEVP